MKITSALGSRLSALGSRLSALGSRLSALGSRLSALGSRLSALGSRLSALGSRLSALGSRLSALGSRLSALGSRLSALGSRLSALGSRLSALGSRLSALGSRLSALGSRLSLPLAAPVKPPEGAAGAFSGARRTPITAGAAPDSDERRAAAVSRPIALSSVCIRSMIAINATSRLRRSRGCRARRLGRCTAPAGWIEARSGGHPCMNGGSARLTGLPLSIRASPTKSVLHHGPLRSRLTRYAGGRTVPGRHGRPPRSRNRVCVPYIEVWCSRTRSGGGAKGSSVWPAPRTRAGAAERSRAAIWVRSGRIRPRLRPETPQCLQPLGPLAGRTHEH